MPPSQAWLSYQYLSGVLKTHLEIPIRIRIDEFTRRTLWIECARILTSVDVARVLDQLVELHGAPTMVMRYPAEANEPTLPITAQPFLQKDLDLVPPKRAQECAGEHSSQ